MMMPEHIKYLFSGLLTVVISRYSSSAVAKSAAGVDVPCNLLATTDASCVFFYVVAQAYPFSGLWCLCVRRGSIEIVAVRAGQPSGWPVSNKAGYANPVRVATNEIGVSGGSNNRYLLEAAIIGTTLTPSHPQYVFVFAAIRRTDTQLRICMLRTVACDEYPVHHSLVQDYMFSFSARLPAGEVTLWTGLRSPATML